MEITKQVWLLWLWVGTVVLGVVGVVCPDYCRCFRKNSLLYVECISKGIINIDLDIPSAVQSLNLSSNSINYLQDYSFKRVGLTKLEILDLSHNALRGVQLHSMVGLKVLTVLDLSYNHLNHILPWTFDSVTSLLSLNLKGNPLKHLPERQPFLVSTSIQSLDISECRLGHLPLFAFSMLASLSHLDISGNQILSISYQTLANIHKLLYLNISRTMMICDSHISSLIDWLEVNKVEIEGSPCPKRTELSGEGANKQKIEDEQMGKMIVITGDDDKSGEFDYSEEKQKEDQQEEEQEQEEEEEEEEEEEKGDTSCDCSKSTLEPPACKRSWNLPLAPPLLLVVAFVAGILIGGIFVIIGFVVRSRRPRRTRLQTSNSITFCPIEDMIEYRLETPPPNYDDLFYDYAPPVPPRIRTRL